MPIIGPVAVQNLDKTFSWCCIELNDSNEVKALHITPATGEGMMPGLDEYTTRIDSDFPSPLPVLDPSDPSGIKAYCFVIEDKKLYRFQSDKFRTIGERVFDSSQAESLKLANLRKMIQLNAIDMHEAALREAGLDEIKSALYRQFYDKHQLRVDFLTMETPPNTRNLLECQREKLKRSEFYHTWLQLKQNSHSGADYWLSLMAVLNHSDTAIWLDDEDQKTARESEIYFLRATLWPERISLLDAFYTDDERLAENQPRLGDVHALMVHLLLQELKYYAIVPFTGEIPKLRPLQYDFRVGNYTSASADTAIDAHASTIQNKTECILDALSNPDIQGDQRSIEHQLRLISGIKDSLFDDCSGLRPSFENYINACIINKLTIERGVSKNTLIQQIEDCRQRLITAWSNQKIEPVKATNPDKTVWNTLRTEMSPRLLMSHDLGPLIIAQLDRLDEASQSLLPSSYWGTPAKVEAAVRALYATLFEVPEGQDPTPYLYRSLFNKANGSLYHAFSCHRLPFFTKAGDPTRAILNMSLAYAKQRLEHLTDTPVGNSLLHEIDRLESATYHYWPWCYNSQNKLDGILDAIIHLQPSVKNISADVLVNAIQQDSELRTALNVHRFFQSTSPTHTLKAIQDAITPSQRS